LGAGEVAAIDAQRRYLKEAGMAAGVYDAEHAAGGHLPQAQMVWLFARGQVAGLAGFIAAFEGRGQGEELLPIGAEGETDDRGLVAGELAAQAEAGGLPQADGGVFAAGGQGLAVGAEGQG
jgi:hypothetical protein